MGNATTKQIEALRKMGYDVPNTLSFEEARTLFDSHKNKPKEMGGGSMMIDGKFVRTPLVNAHKESKSYHLTPEQVRYNALDIVLRRYPNLETPALLKEAETVEKWMLE
jgi:hypothetical protein